MIYFDEVRHVMDIESFQKHHDAPCIHIYSSMGTYVQTCDKGEEYWWISQTHPPQTRKACNPRHHSTYTNPRIEPGTFWNGCIPGLGIWRQGLCHPQKKRYTNTVREKKMDGERDRKRKKEDTKKTKKLRYPQKLTGWVYDLRLIHGDPDGTSICIGE